VGGPVDVESLRRLAAPAGRLEEARTELLRANCTLSMSQIAVHHGFSNPSRFAQLYRRTYGACPSDVSTAVPEDFGGNENNEAAAAEGR